MFQSTLARCSSMQFTRLSLTPSVGALSQFPIMENASAAQGESAEADPPDAGPVGLGDAVASASTQDSPETLGPKVMAAETIPEPQPGQTRPDAKGRCPRKRQVALNGGCWVTVSADQEE